MQQLLPGLWLLLLSDRGNFWRIWEQESVSYAFPTPPTPHPPPRVYIQGDCNLLQGKGVQINLVAHEICLMLLPASPTASV